jgi:hypothetical protein
VVVGAGSVVRGVFGDHCVLAGVPARVVRAYVPGGGWQPARPGPELAADGVAGVLADPEGVQGVPEPPHPVL